jgi:hypothetical protein
MDPFEELFGFDRKDAPGASTTPEDAEQQRCTAERVFPDEDTFDCELPDGHEGEHRSTVRWEDVEEG